MIKRRTTSIVKIHSLKIGWTEPVIIQSMTKVPTTNVQKCINKPLISVIVKISISLQCVTSLFPL